MRETDVAVVGAGPAGMAAAIAAAEAGARVTLIDEYGMPGGQFFKRADASFSIEPSQLSREHGRGEELREKLSASRVSVLAHTLVWGVFDNELMLYGNNKSETLRTKAIVLATGAYDRPVAFPGWTLPGVMGAGGAQTLAKTQWVKAGRKILLSGSGPLLLPVARQLLLAKAEIVAVVEATTPSQWLRLASAAWGQWSRFAEAIECWRHFRKNRVPLLFGHKIARALGADKVEAAVIAKIDRNWNAITETERILDVDAIAVGYGLLPNIELAASCGCNLYWDNSVRAWFVACDSRMATNRFNVFVAGEITGIGGSELALNEGILAGISAAESIGIISTKIADERLAMPSRRRKRLANFANVLNRSYGPRAGLWEGLESDNTTICRCEEVTRGVIASAVRNGCSSLKEVKDLTRAGMGLCQGRMCRNMVAEIIAREQQKQVEKIAFPHVRPPIKPVPIAAIVASDSSK